MLLSSRTHNYFEMGKHKGQWKDEDDELIIGDYDVITVVGLTVINVA